MSLTAIIFEFINKYMLITPHNDYQSCEGGKNMNLNINYN